MTATQRSIPSTAGSYPLAITPRRSVEAIRIDASRLLPRVDAEVRAMRTDADARRGALATWADMRAADRLDAEAKALQDAADELRWLASLSS